ncbi:MAG: hypothetical protein IJ491_07345 [Clostridia bacterium]|nr:hypothetical protein [Clostridia bacterium]
MKNYRWMKIDTASIMFTCLSTKKWGRTFRMAVVFKDEEVNPKLLEQAVRELMPRYPSIYSQLKKGFFWNYQECTTLLPEIREEFTRPIVPITLNNDGRPDFRIVYYKRRLGLESAHHIGDGKGVSAYFDALLERYVELCDDPQSVYKPLEAAEDEDINAFNKYYQKGGEKAENDDVDAYRIPGEIENGFLQLVFAMSSSDDIRAKSKERNLTVTEFIASAFILGTIRHSQKPIDKIISLAIPVNLRKYFPTDSVRNFTIQSKIDFDPQGRTDWTFDEICDVVRGQLKERLTTEKLQKTLNKFGSLANNPVIKFVPNFIKLPVIRKMQHSSHSANTTIITNTGESSMSENLSSRIERIDGVNGDTSGYGLISTCSVCSGNGLINLCFSVCSHDVSWPRECIRALAEQGLDIRVETTNAIEKEAEDFKDMRCKHCNVDLSEAYATCPLCGEAAVNEEVRLNGLRHSPYPKNAPVKSAEKCKKTKRDFDFEMVKAYFNT